MIIKHPVRVFIVSFLICVSANAQVARLQTAVADPESLRQLLANQPDYTAMQQFQFSEGFGAFGARSKVAKMGNKQVEVTDNAVFINEPGKPTIKVFPKRKQYSEFPAEKNDDFSVSPDEIARRSDMVFKSLGRETVGKYMCLKIEAAYQDERLKEMKFVFWAAPQLKNLVIKSEMYIGEQVKFLTLLEDVSLGVNQKLFRIPPGYRKVIEPDYLKRLDENNRKPR